jgi:hypothetical protein
MKLIHEIRKNSFLKNIITYFVFCWTLFGVVLSYSNFLFNHTNFPTLISTSLYFTIQSNLLVFIVVAIYTFKKNTKLFKYFSFIVMINLSITGIVFYTLLASEMSSGISFTNHVLHAITPMIYLLFYMIILEESLPLKKFWVALIYPLSYMLFVFLIVAPFLGEMIEQYITSFQGIRYIYPFLDPANYSGGFIHMLGFNLFVMMPSFILISLFIIFIKSSIENKIKSIS